MTKTENRAEWRVERCEWPNFSGAIKSNHTDPSKLATL